MLCSVVPLLAERCVATLSCICMHQSSVSNSRDVLRISKALCNYACLSVGALIKSSSMARGSSKISTQPSVFSAHQTGKLLHTDSNISWNGTQTAQTAAKANCPGLYDANLQTRQLCLDICPKPLELCFLYVV